MQSAYKNARLAEVLAKYQTAGICYLLVASMTLPHTLQYKMALKSVGASALKLQFGQTCLHLNGRSKPASIYKNRCLSIFGDCVVSSKTVPFGNGC